MKNNPLTPIAVDQLKFDKFGQYDLVEVIPESELDLIYGGDTVVNNCGDRLCPKINFSCKEPKNQRCGEDGGDN